MAISQEKSKRSATGAKYQAHRKKRRSVIGSGPANTRPGTTKLKTVRARGGSDKYALLKVEMANLLDPKTKKYVKAKISSVSDNPANRHYTRRNIITKGALITTDKGEARVTSRPGQDGTVNAVLIK